MHAAQERKSGMYISVKLPPEFGAFNRLRKENYPFNNLFTTYLAAVSRLGLKLSVDVDELVGYIEDRVFDGQRLPDVPDGSEAVNFRYRTEDEDVTAYIGASRFTNRMAVMYIARMTLRLSAAYGNSLFRLTRLINDLAGTKVKAGRIKAEKTEKTPAPRPRREIVEDAPASDSYEEPVSEQPVRKEPVPPRTTRRVAVPPTPIRENPQPIRETVQPARPANDPAAAARAALSELESLTAEAAGDDIVETNPALAQFGGI